MAACLATTTGLCSGSSSTPVASWMRVVTAAAKVRVSERVEPVGVGGHGDAPVGRVRVPRRLRVEHHDVLARPQRGEPVLFGAERHGADDLRSRARADAERVQAQPHAESPIVA